VPRIVPEVGRYESAGEAEYHHVWDAWNVSRLKNLKRTPAHCRYAIDNPREKSSDAMRDGKALHCAVLEPESFDSRFALDPESPDGGYPRGWRNTKDYKALKSEMLNSGITPLPLDISEACMRLRDRLYETLSHARDLLMAQTGTEVSYAVDDPRTELRCKLRNDLEVRDAGMIVDLKKTESIAGFERQLFNYGYYLSVPHYMDLMEAFEPGGWKHHAFLVVELDPPYEFRTLQLRPEAIEYARRQWHKLMDMAAECVASNRWPGYNRSVEYVDLPYWVYNQEGFEDG